MLTTKREVGNKRGYVIMRVKTYANRVAEHLNTLPTGTEISTSEAISAVYEFKFLLNGEYSIDGEMVGMKELFKIDEIVRGAVRKFNIKLDDSKYYGQAVGMPFNIPYVIRRNRCK